jgi:hypothetical protein
MVFERPGQQGAHFAFETGTGQHRLSGETVSTGLSTAPMAEKAEEPPICMPVKTVILHLINILPYITTPPLLILAAQETVIGHQGFHVTGKFLEILPAVTDVVQ